MKSKRTRRWNESKQKLNYDVAQEYMQEHGVSEVDPAAVVKWAKSKGKLQNPKHDPDKILTREMSRALAAQYEVDPQGREVRSMIPIPVVSEGGQGYLWAPIFSATGENFRLSQQIRRKHLYGGCRQHKTDTESYNDNNIHGDEVGLFSYDFNQDLAEAAQPTEYPDDAPDTTVN